MMLIGVDECDGRFMRGFLRIGVGSGALEPVGMRERISGDLDGVRVPAVSKWSVCGCSIGCALTAALRVLILSISIDLSDVSFLSRVESTMIELISRIFSTSRGVLLVSFVGRVVFLLGSSGRCSGCLEGSSESSSLNLLIVSSNS